MRFSLIVATAGRTSELSGLLGSLDRQVFRDFEVIIVDQNPDERLLPVVRQFEDRLAIRHQRSSIRGLSHARNIGVLLASGDIIAFPDDDCLYPPDVLAFVDRRFTIDPDLACLSGPSVTPAGRRGSARWMIDGGPITMDSVWTSVIAFGFFVRADALGRAGPFDEELGIGGRFGSAEETDLVLRVIAAGGKALYDPALAIVHPDKRLTAEATRRAFRYGSGLGRVLRKHRAPARIVLKFLARPVGGMLWACLSLRPRAARYYATTLLGRIAGYLARAGSAAMTARAHAL